MKMSPEYMAELHNFLYRSNDTDINRLKATVATHLRFIPHKKLYRYRKCTDRELLMLEKNSIWLSDPQNFPDMFDATMPIGRLDVLDFEYAFYCTFEIMYIALQKVATEDNEPIPEKEDLLNAVIDIKGKYTQEEVEEKLREIYGDEEKFNQRPRVGKNVDFSKPVDRTRKILDTLVTAPRRNSAIASFTTRFDNRNMWENYAENYSGFCVEYDFSGAIHNLTSKNAWDILHILSVTYYRKRPLFDYYSLLQKIIQADINQGDFSLYTDDFFPQYYRAITAKQYDYRAEQEWRLVLEHDNIGQYSFPYASGIYVGKDMPKQRRQQIHLIAEKLEIPFFIQTIGSNQNGFEYKRD